MAAAQENGFEPIDVGAYIITTPRGYDPLTGTINQGGFQGNRYPGKEYNNQYNSQQYNSQAAGQNGYVPIDASPLIVNTPEGYNPLTGTIEQPIDNSPYYVNQPSAQDNSYPGKQYSDPFLRGGK